MQQDLRQHLPSATTHAQSWSWPSNTQIQVFTLFQSFQIQTSPEGNESRKNQRCSSSLCAGVFSRNMCAFIRAKSHSSVPIVANASLIRVRIPRTWPRRSVTRIHNQHWILIYIHHPPKYRHRRQRPAIPPWLRSLPHVPCWISVPLLWLLSLQPLPNSNSISSNKEKIPILPHRNLILAVHHLQPGPICRHPFRWRHLHRLRHRTAITTMRPMKSKREKFHRWARPWESVNAAVYSLRITTIRFSPLQAPICWINNNWICYVPTMHSILIRMSMNCTRSPNVSVSVNSTFNTGSTSCVQVMQRPIISNHPRIHSFHQQPPAETPRRRPPRQLTQQPHPFYLWPTIICVHHWWLLRPQAVLLYRLHCHLHFHRSVPIHHANKPNH